MRFPRSTSRYTCPRRSVVVVFTIAALAVIGLFNVDGVFARTESLGESVKVTLPSASLAALYQSCNNPDNLYIENCWTNIHPVFPLTDTAYYTFRVYNPWYNGYDPEPWLVPWCIYSSPIGVNWTECEVADTVYVGGAYSYDWTEVPVAIPLNGIVGDGLIEIYFEQLWGWDYSWADLNTTVIGHSTFVFDPPSATIQVNANVNNEHWFNSSGNGITWPAVPSYSVSCTGTITDCQVSSGSVSYNPGTTGGRITLTVSVTAGDSIYADTAFVDVVAQIPQTYNVSVTPYKTSIFQQALTPGTVKFKVTNTGNAQGNYALTVTCTGDISNCSAPSSSVVPAGAYNDVQVSFTAGQNFGTAVIALKASYSGYEGQGSTGITNDPLPPRCQ